MQLLKDLPSGTVTCYSLILSVGTTRSQKHTGANFVVVKTIAANTVTVCVVSWNTVNSINQSLGCICSLQEISFHGDPHIGLDLVILAGTVSLQAGNAIAKSSK